MFRVITGGIVILLGLWFVYLGVVASKVFFIHASALLVLGVVIVFNTHEDDIEEITNDKNIQ